jgi:Kef-type K+ transport system membrane component KefB
MCFGVAWLTYLAGLSLALGAFLAGLIISIKLGSEFEEIQSGLSK